MGKGIVSTAEGIEAVPGRNLLVEDQPAGGSIAGILRGRLGRGCLSERGKSPHKLPEALLAHLGRRYRRLPLTRTWFTGHCHAKTDAPTNRQGRDLKKQNAS
jgi:hypothetical protein